jgi:hypothetical protein
MIKQSIPRQELREFKSEWRRYYKEKIESISYELDLLFDELYAERFFDDPPFTKQVFLSNVLVALIDNMSGNLYREGLDFVWEQFKKNDPRFELRWRIGERIDLELQVGLVCEKDQVAEENKFIVSTLLSRFAEQLRVDAKKSLDEEMEKGIEDGNFPHDWVKGRREYSWGDLEEESVPDGPYLLSVEEERSLASDRFEM